MNLQAMEMHQLKLERQSWLQCVISVQDYYLS